MSAEDDELAPPKPKVFRALAFMVLYFVVALVVGVGSLALLFGGGGPDSPTNESYLYAAVFCFSSLATLVKFPRLGLVPVAIYCGVVYVWFQGLEPELERDWKEEHSRITRVERLPEGLRLHDVRRFRYKTDTRWDARWMDEVYDPKRITGVDIFYVPESAVDGRSHALLSFRFEGDKTMKRRKRSPARYLAFNVEPRKEKGENRYSPLRAQFHQYELYYVVADELDIVELFSVHRRDNTYLYPTRLTPEQGAELFVDVLERIDQLSQQPEWFDPLMNNAALELCTLLGLEKNAPGDLRHRDMTQFLKVVGDTGIIESDGTPNEANLINSRAFPERGKRSLSTKIREAPKL